MKIGSFLRNNATRLALVCAIAAVLLFVPAALTVSVALRAFLIVVIVLLLLCGGVLVFWGNRRGVGRIHYFLYDRRRCRYYQREELNADIIQDAMAHYLQGFLNEEISLWKEIPKPLRLQLEGEEQFAPLVAYRMLTLLSACEPQDALAIFGRAGEQTVTYLCRAISECGDSELADYIYHLKKNFATEQERIALFFVKNKRTFAARILRYVDRHFDEFYVAKSRISK